MRLHFTSCYIHSCWPWIAIVLIPGLSSRRQKSVLSRIPIATRVSTASWVEPSKVSSITVIAKSSTSRYSIYCYLLSLLYYDRPCWTTGSLLCQVAFYSHVLYGLELDHHSSFYCVIWENGLHEEKQDCRMGHYA